MLSALKIEEGATSQGMQVASKRNRYIQKKQILPQKEHSPADILILGFLTSTTVIKRCCFKLLSYGFCTAAIGN